MPKSKNPGGNSLTAKRAVGAFPLNGRGERVRLLISPYGGQDRVDLRVWYRGIREKSASIRRVINITIHELSEPDDTSASLAGTSRAFKPPTDTDGETQMYGSQTALRATKDKAVRQGHNSYKSLPREVADAVGRGEKLQAVLLYRKATGISVKEARKIIEKAQLRANDTA